MKKVLITLVSLFLMLYGSCNKKSVKVHGIDVSPLLTEVAKEQNIDYCKLLENALKGDTNSILQFSLLEFYDGCGYDHGAVLVDMIQMIGEETYRVRPFSGFSYRADIYPAVFAFYRIRL